MFLEKDNYYVVTQPCGTILVARKSVNSYIYPYCPSSFKGPPQFRYIHTISTINGIFACDCCMKDRYGIPCRHLFAVEPMYTLLDIHCRWQVKYAHHFHTEGSGNITKAYKERIILEHNGIEK